MSHRLHSFSELSTLFGDPDASARATKNGASAEAARREVFPMQSIAERPRQASLAANFGVEAIKKTPDGAAQIAAYLASAFDLARRYPIGEMHSEAISISPEAAAYILANHNAGNRPVRQVRVDEFARIIVEGRWKVTSQGISFSREGDLNNGQHRLSGIVAAGQTVGMYVTFGEDRDVFDVLDTGAVRGGSDTLHIRGYKNTSCLAAAARLLVTVEGNHVFNAPKVRNDEILLIAARHPRLQDATVPGHTLGSKFRCSTAAMTVALYRIMTLTRRPDKVDGFIKSLSEGSGLEARDPVLVLRDGLQTKKIDSHIRLSTQKTLAQYAGIVKAWNLHSRGRKGSLRWEHPEPLPRPE